MQHVLWVSRVDLSHTHALRVRKDSSSTYRVPLNAFTALHRTHRDGLERTNALHVTLGNTARRLEALCATTAWQGCGKMSKARVAVRCVAQDSMGKQPQRRKRVSHARVESMQTKRRKHFAARVPLDTVRRRAKERNVTHALWVS